MRYAILLISMHLALLTACGSASRGDRRASIGRDDGPVIVTKVQGEKMSPGLDECLAGSKADFIATVLPALKSCLACHTSDGSAASTRLKLGGSNDEAYATFLQVIDAVDPAQSLIVRKPTAEVAHGGGQILKTSSPEVRTVQDFIKNAASRSTCDHSDLQSSSKLCKADSPTLKKRIWRLSQRQYETTIRVGLGGQFGDLTAKFGDPKPYIGFATTPENLKIDEISAASLRGSAAAIASKHVVVDPAARACVLTNGNKCAVAIGVDLADRLWRRPANGDDRQRFATLFGSVLTESSSRTVAVSAVVEFALLSPNFLYRFEIGSGAGQDGVLDDYEIANMLSYTLWGRQPDEQLKQLAAAGKLTDGDVLEQQFLRMAADAKMKPEVFELFNDWLKLDNVLTTEKDDAALGATFSPAIRQSLLASARRLIDVKVWESSGDLRAVMEGRDLYMNAPIAALLGLPTTGMSDELVAAEARDRVGILTHPAFIAGMSGKKATGMVHRGFFVLKQVLGIDLPPPPANVVASGKIPAGTDLQKLTTRKEFEYLHSSTAQCAGCHVKLDPVGGAFESFDPLGRYRDVEKGTVKIDSSGALKEDGIAIKYADSIGFVAGVARSQRLKSRFSEVLLGHFLGTGSPQDLPCELDDLRRANADADSIKSQVQGLRKIRSLIKRQKEGV